MSTEEIQELDKLNLITERIIGCTIEVHRALGPGLLERTYEEAMCLEMQRRRLNFARNLCVLRVPLCLCGFVGKSAIRKSPRLLEVPLRFFERPAFRVFPRRALGARESRAGVNVVDRAVEDVASLVCLDLDLPAAERLPALRVTFGSHVTVSPQARRRGCPTRSTSHRNFSRSDIRAGA